MHILDKYQKPKEGHLEIVALDKDGRRVLVSDHNLIVNNAVNILRRSLTEIGDDYRLTHLALGRDATGEPTAGQTALVNEQLVVPFTNITFPTIDSIRFQTMVTHEIGNGIPFTEAALVAHVAPAGQRLFAVKRHQSVTKNNELVLEYNWTIVFQNGGM